MNLATSATHMKQFLRPSALSLQKKQKKRTTNHLRILRPLLTLKKHRFSLMTIRTRLIRPRQRRITPNIRNHTSRFARGPAKDVPEYAVVGRRLGRLARAAAVQEDVVETVFVGVEHVGAMRGVSWIVGERGRVGGRAIHGRNGRRLCRVSLCGPRGRGCRRLTWRSREEGAVAGGRGEGRG